MVMRSANNGVIDLIGNTPLIRVIRTAANLPSDVEVYVKAEWFNPGGSVKDRAGLSIVRDAMNRGLLKPNGTLLDSSSGNTGIAYAMLGAALDFNVVLCVPSNASMERIRTLRAFGAELVLTDPREGSDGAQMKAKALHAENPERYFYANQYGNERNWRAHYETTGPELAQQTDGRLTHVVTGLGTTGTCMGLSRYVREKLPNAKVVAFGPDSPFHGLEGLKHLETAIVPEIYDEAIPHLRTTCDTDRAYETCRRVANLDGLFLGISAGAALAVALRIAAQEAEAGRKACIVSIGCDSGARYLSQQMWDLK